MLAATYRLTDSVNWQLPIHVLIASLLEWEAQFILKLGYKIIDKYKFFFAIKFSYQICHGKGKLNLRTV